MARTETMSSSWVEGYRELASPVSESPGTGRCERRRLGRDPSSENLFVDLGARPRCPQSGKFLQNLIYHGSQLETINEAVGLAQVTGRGSMLSSIFTLVASAMGAGCLSLPHMFSKVGLGLGLLLLTCGAVLAHISLVILMSCARYTQSRSFAELVSQLQEENLDGHGPVRDLSVDVVITLYGMAAVLIYMMLIGDFMSDIARSPLFNLDEVSRHRVIMASLLVVFPLSIPRHVTALRYISFLSISAIVFLTLVVAAKTPGHWRDAVELDQLDTVKYSLWTVLQSFAMALFSFNAHTNAVPVALSLDQPRATRIWYVALSSVLIELVIYATIATSGLHPELSRRGPVDAGGALCLFGAHHLWGSHELSTGGSLHAGFDRSFDGKVLEFPSSTQRPLQPLRRIRAVLLPARVHRQFCVGLLCRGVHLLRRLRGCHRTLWRLLWNADLPHLATEDLLESHEGFTYKSASHGDFSGTLLRCVLGHGCLH